MLSSFSRPPIFSDIYTTLSQPVDPNNLPQACLPHYQRLLQASADPKNPPDAATVWTEYYRHSPDYQQHVGRRLQSNTGFPQVPMQQQQSQPQTQTEQMVSQGKQFGVLAQRYFELIRRDWQSLVVLIAVMPIIGLLLLFMADKYDLVGKNQSEIRQEIQEDIREKRVDEDRRDDNEQFQGIYQVVGSTQRVLFIMALAGSLLGLFAASYEIVKEEPIYQRERMVNLKIGPYLLSKMVVLAGFAFGTSLFVSASIAHEDNISRPGRVFTGWH
ncbi:MAG: ABC transporter permease [Chloroflexi bacterium]|nr:ABC transporter permease [Chloroflexota bacterium]